ncbi:TPA: protein SdcA [Legionella pneumophila]|uniref:protein SdcA n=1 Tax=Legionella pneumophila TaxID=446 RepID=UPI0009B56AEB|nr:protein SdcA [Legionella pneumophila]MDW8878071.1 protein SdcA [Legionella pneumophila subsp. fraseri]MDW8962435.1 protein SdcA [Legionella pneumophila subsp. fraseri]MDW9036085.1 protein SdcA [Legionella pneumophila subsp. fraseri]MDW9038665.1 protein SdcA [Legionella pneumophila subsp. fraseri]MDW9042487.1 protein SdcA [Legionella pneumophila subsp. fraseri]
MVINMVDVIKFKEPERCDYLYIDENNKVHILLPIVGGDEIGLDNTCQTAVELITFFYGSAHSGETKYSAEHQLSEYKRQLEEDIKAINSQKKISPHAYDDLLKEKKERLQQIEKYIELIQVLKKQYDEQNDIGQLRTAGIPQLPSGVKEIIKSSENAFAVRLSPYDNDKFTRFDNPLFNVKRNISKYDTPSRQAPIPIHEGLGYRLRSTLFPEDKTPTPINKKSTQEKIIETVLAQVDADYMKDGDKEQKLGELKKLIQQELVKIDSNLSVDMSRDGKEVNLNYLELVMAVDDDSTMKEWIEGIIEASVDPTVWEAQASSPFYDGAKEIKSDRDADRMSIKVQYLLAEANIYCKTNKLSDANFGEFFDKEPHATEIAKRVREGFTRGEEIEPIIYDYINSNHAELGLKSPLISEQQQEITEKFARHYNTIKESPHFDEFFVADPDKKGNIFSHQGRMSCHFLDFFTRQTKGKHPLGDLAGHQEALQEETSNRLHHKNEVVAQGYEKLDQFKKEIVKLLAENKPKELLDYLVATSPTGVPNYSMLSKETQNYIAYNRNWPAIQKELEKTTSIPVSQKQDLLRLLSRDNLQHDNLSAITWSRYSSKPLLDVELNKIAEGLELTAKIYNEKRGREWWFKGSRNEARKTQCEELQRVSKEINTLLQSESLTKSQVLEKVLNSIETLDKIDRDISAESNWFQSTLQKEVRSFRDQLKDICQLDKYAFKSTKLDEIISLEMEEQFQKIQDPTVQQIVRDLPSHCHNDEAIEFFKTLSPEEAAKVASYLSLEYREINKSTDKKTLLEQDIPKLFKEVNTLLLSKLKEEKAIDEQVHEKLSQLADKIPPEHFTRNNIKKWSATPEKLEESNLNELIKSVQGPTTQTAKQFREAMSEITGRNEPPRDTHGHTI